MRVTKRQLRHIIKESLLREYGRNDPASRGEPGHRGDDGNWVDPGMPGYNPMKDKTLGPDGGYPQSELSKAKTAHKNAAGYMGPQIDKSWKHPAFR